MRPPVRRGPVPRDRESIHDAALDANVPAGQTRLGHVDHDGAGRYGATLSNLVDRLRGEFTVAVPDETHPDATAPHWKQLALARLPWGEP